MGSAKLDKVLEDVKTLTAAELRQLREVLDRLLASVQVQPGEDEFEQQLLHSGVLSEVKPTITDFTPYQNRTPVEARGKPLSEVIVEERR